jgi:hypothetical protein
MESEEPVTVLNLPFGAATTPERGKTAKLAHFCNGIKTGRGSKRERSAANAPKKPKRIEFYRILQKSKTQGKPGHVHPNLRSLQCVSIFRCLKFGVQTTHWQYGRIPSSTARMGCVTSVIHNNGNCGPASVKRQWVKFHKRVSCARLRMVGSGNDGPGYLRSAHSTSPSHRPVA